MLRRKISIFLSDWTMRSKRKSLIVEGSRLVGKTTAIKSFIETHYDDSCSIYLSFKNNPNMVRLFNRKLKVSRLYQELKIRFPNKIFDTNRTIIFFDDIQLCPNLISYMKDFTENGLYDIIAAGSSLGVLYNKYPFPIGYVDRYTLSPMDFEEYLWANGFDVERLNYLEDLYKSNEYKISASHDILIDLFREYMVIGGMPEVVSEYLKEHNFKLAFEIQQDILQIMYEEMDIHASKITARKLRDTIESLPKQLSKDNKKFQYKLITEKGRASSHKVCLDWLLDSNIILKSTNLDIPVQPLSDHMREDTFKIYLQDPGLLVSLYGEDTQLKILRGDIMVHNGAVLENTIASILHMNGFNLYYYENNSTIDVDFLIVKDRHITPVLGKHADNPKSKVLRTLKDKFGIEYGVRLSSEHSRTHDKIETIPLYMSIFLER